MRLLCVVPAAALALVPLSHAQQSGSGLIEGRVLRTGTSTSVVGVEIVISRLAPSLPATEEARVAAGFAASELLRARRGGPVASSSSQVEREKFYGFPRGSLTPEHLDYVLTNDEGRFSFKNLAPGRYLVHSQLGMNFALTPSGTIAAILREEVTVEEGKATPSVTFFLARGSSISGTIRTSSGQPVVEASVQPNRKVYLFPALSYTPTSVTQYTNDQGEYRLSGLQPGEYFISAAPKVLVEGTTMRAPGTPPPWDQTFFPGETDPDRLYPLSSRRMARTSQVSISSSEILRPSRSRFQALPSIRCPTPVSTHGRAPRSGRSMISS